MVHALSRPEAASALVHHVLMRTADTPEEFAKAAQGTEEVASAVVHSEHSARSGPPRLESGQRKASDASERLVGELHPRHSE